MKEFIQAGKTLNPLNKFLADALGVPGELMEQRPQKSDFQGWIGTGACNS